MSTAKKYVARAPDAKRNAEIVKIHIGCKTLGIEGDDYRAFLMRITGLQSTAKMSDGQRGAVLDELRRLGFRSPATSQPNQRPGQPQERLAIALWKDLDALERARRSQRSGAAKIRTPVN